MSRTLIEIENHNGVYMKVYMNDQAEAEQIEIYSNDLEDYVLTNDPVFQSENWKQTFKDKLFNYQLAKFQKSEPEDFGDGDAA